MNKSISPMLEGSSSYNLFYELNNGHVLQVYNDVPETQTELDEMSASDPEHREFYEKGEVYQVIEYDPQKMVDLYAEQGGAMDIGEAEDVAEVYHYGVYYGNNAIENGLFADLEKRGIDIEGRYVPYTTSVVDFIDPKERYEQSIRVKNIEYTGVYPYDMSVLEGNIELENGTAYDFSYNTLNHRLVVYDDDANKVMEQVPDEFRSYDEVDLNIISAFKDLRTREADIQFWPEMSDEHVESWERDGERWISGSFQIGKGGLNPRIQFDYNESTEDLDMTRMCGWYQGNVPMHLTECVYDKAAELVREFREKEKEAEKTASLADDKPRSKSEARGR